MEEPRRQNWRLLACRLCGSNGEIIYAKPSSSLDNTVGNVGNSCFRADLGGSQVLEWHGERTRLQPTTHFSYNQSFSCPRRTGMTFSIVPLRPNFMLISEEHLVKAYKNQ